MKVSAVRHDHNCRITTPFQTPNPICDTLQEISDGASRIAALEAAYRTAAQGLATAQAGDARLRQEAHHLANDQSAQVRKPGIPLYDTNKALIWLWLLLHADIMCTFAGQRPCMCVPVQASACVSSMCACACVCLGLSVSVSVIVWV